MAEGKPAFNAGLPAAYWIWHDHEGWHLRVTSGDMRHQFMGIVETKVGFIQNFKPTNQEWREKVQIEGERRIRFDFAAQGNIEGFDWLNPSNCNTFDLYIDGAPHQEKISVGTLGDHPPTAIFEACR